MPNWCQNRLIVEGSVSDIKRFEEANKSDESLLTFAAAVPRPASEDDNWHEWNCDNWGSKWDAVDVELLDEGELWYPAEGKSETTYKFDTAWSPPSYWFLALGRKWPELRLLLFYAEFGMGFSGSCEWCDGEFSNSESLDMGELIDMAFENRA